MYELIVIACLVSQPVKCEEFYIPFQQATDALHCAQDAEFQLVQWAAERPEWQIRRWTCGTPKA
jgi:hypothetical protein